MLDRLELARLALATLDKQRQFFKADPWDRDRDTYLRESKELEKQLRDEAAQIIGNGNQATLFN